MNVIATVPTQMPLTTGFGSRRPKSSISAAPVAGNSGMIQMVVRKNISALMMTRLAQLFMPADAGRLPFQQIDFIHVHRGTVTEEGDQDSEANRCFRGRIGGNKNSEDLAM